MGWLNLKLKIRASLFFAFLIIFMGHLCDGYTDPRDVFAINSLYVALEYPPLPGWVPNGGDPCLEAWVGVECVNSNITGIVLSGASLGGVLSPDLELFTSMIVIDLSNNHIGGTIPINLPLTMRNFSLSANQFTGGIPSTLSSLSQLTDMSFSNNNLTGDVPDTFQALVSLVNLDLSGNNLSGVLPPSFANLLSLTTLHLQDNHLSGTLDVLQDLPLRDLNIENNIFSGPIPDKLLRIPDFKKDGNPFNTTIIPSTPLGPTLPPLSAPPSSAPTPGKENDVPSVVRPSPEDANNIGKTKKIMWWAIPVALVLVIGFGLLVCMLKHRKGKKQDNKLPKKPMMGGPSGRVEKDIESCFQSNSVVKEDPKAAVVRPKDDHGITVPRWGTLPNQRDKEQGEMNTLGAFGKGDQENGENMTRRDLTMVPPLEKFETSPSVPTVVTTGKTPSKSLKQLGSVRSFTIASLQQYTNSFSQENLIGGGTLGSVYRAELPDRKLLAVKKLDNTAYILQRDDQFLDLVASISKLQNANLVELEGYCLEHGQRLLIHGYCSNGTLHDALHSGGLAKTLSWNARIRTALGAARALEYLHETCYPPIIHRNFKSANILLSDDLAPRVSDCGLAPLLSTTTMSQLSRQVSAHGYGAPEFEMGTYSCPSDVYSFGVVMLELLTGRKSYDSSRPRSEQYLVRWAIPQLHDIDALSQMVDPSLNGAYPAKSLSRFADIISLCVQSEPEFRPPMSEIVESLLNMVQRR